MRYSVEASAAGPSLGKRIEHGYMVNAFDAGYQSMRLGRAVRLKS